jgi:hypothetical protein
MQKKKKKKKKKKRNLIFCFSAVPLCTALVAQWGPSIQDALPLFEEVEKQKKKYFFFCKIYFGLFFLVF